MSFCTSGMKGDVFSLDKPRKGDSEVRFAHSATSVFKFSSSSLLKFKGDGWRKKQVYSFFLEIGWLLTNLLTS
jgi:hypothetical protein